MLNIEGPNMLQIRIWEYINSHCLKCCQKHTKAIFICLSVFIFKQLFNAVAMVKNKTKSLNKDIQREQWCYKPVSYTRKMDRSRWRKESQQDQHNSYTDKLVICQVLSRITETAKGFGKWINSLCHSLPCLKYLSKWFVEPVHYLKQKDRQLTLRQLMSYIYIWSTHSWCF